MPFEPKKLKYRKHHRDRGAAKGIAWRGNEISFGSYGLKAISGGEISSRQIEAARRAITRYVKRTGKIWIRIFPQRVITKKAQEVPMGSGKGVPSGFVAEIRPGRVLFEMDGVSGETAVEALRLAGHKLPVKTKILAK